MYQATRVEIRNARLVQFWPDYIPSKSRLRKNKRRERLKWRKRGRLRKSYRDKIIAELGNYCRLCKSYSNITIDHMLRRADGGSNHKSNLQVLCEPCHILKEKAYDVFKKECKINNESFNHGWMRTHWVQHREVLFGWELERSYCGQSGEILSAWTSGQREEESF